MPEQDNSQWSSLSSLLGELPSRWPVGDAERLAAYEKYDQMYWNDPTQYAIRVLESEQPLYIPNARVIVNTTAYYLAKGLNITLGEGKTAANTLFLEDFLKRETFYSKFNLLKHTTVNRGDGVFHLLGNPNKDSGKRVSLETLHPGSVYTTYDPEDETKVIQVDIVSIWEDPAILAQGQNINAERIRVLTYFKEPGTNLVEREEVAYELADHWWEIDAEAYLILREREALPEPINQIPIYWFKNIEWDEEYGSSELRGLELLQGAISQGATDTQAALGLEGLGVYATDGGRPVDDQGNEAEWEVSPGKVMEVPQGSYFRRVEGVGSITPMMDQIEYLEKKANAAAGITGVATGDVDVALAESGIALAIKFLPTLAKLEFRDQHFVDRLTQMFYDLRDWFTAYEDETFDATIQVKIAEDKLPINRKERLNELNNMMDRKIISRKYYRQEVGKLGYEFPSDESLENEIDADSLRETNRQLELEILKASLTPDPQDKPDDSEVEGSLPPESNPDFGSHDLKQESKSNNTNRVNESSGTEA